MDKSALIAALKALKKKLPHALRVAEKYATEYHSILDDLSRLSGKNLARYRVPGTEIVSVTTSKEPVDELTWRVARERRCDRAFLLTKLDTVLKLFRFKTEPKKARIGF